MCAFAVDFGNALSFFKRLCELPLEMSIQPSYYHRCCLGNIKPVDGDEWNQNLISRFKGITNNELQMKVNIINFHPHSVL